MRGKTIVALMLAITLFADVAAFAHPPKSISASMDAESNTLNVTAEHNVNDPTKHYVMSLVIYEGNKLLFQKHYDRQFSAEEFRDSVVLKGLTSGTRIRIQVICNIMGTTETEYTIP